MNYLDKNLFIRATLEILKLIKLLDCGYVVAVPFIKSNINKLTKIDISLILFLIKINLKFDLKISYLYLFYKLLYNFKTFDLKVVMKKHYFN